MLRLIFDQILIDSQNAGYFLHNNIFKLLVLKALHFTKLHFENSL